jgi:hypothetical protein
MHGHTIVKLPEEFLLDPYRFNTVATLNEAPIQLAFFQRKEKAQCTSWYILESFISFRPERLS